MIMDNIKYNKIQAEYGMAFLMKKVKKVNLYLCISFVLLLFMSSCSTSKEFFNDYIIDSITDPKTGTPIFIREYDTEPYQINVAEIVRSRKALKKKKIMEIIEKYDTLQDKTQN